MIWEVDEDCDGMVSWVEFQTMYTRQVNLSGRKYENVDTYRSLLEGDGNDTN